MLAKLIAKFFTWYIKRIVRTDFASFNFNHVSVDSSKSILLLANHFSWWDGFLMYELNRRYFKKSFHVMVTEENYKKISFLKHLGAFPINKSSKGVVQTLEYAGTLLNTENNLVLIFPQGQLYSNHVDDIQFGRGVTSIIKSSQKNFQLVFASSFIDYFEKRKPTVTCYLKNWEGVDFDSLELMRDAYNQHHETSRQQHCRITV